MKAPSKSDYPVVDTFLQTMGMKQVGTGVTTYKDTDSVYYVFFAAVTPAVAAEIIKNWNDHNRHRNDDHVKRLARQRLEDKWWLNGTTLCFSTDGKLLDGGNRVFMVKATRETTVWPIVLGVPLGAFVSYDLHNRRKLVHVLQVAGKTQEQLRQKVVCHLFRYENGQCFEHRHPTPDPLDGLDVLKRNELAVNEAINYVTATKHDVPVGNDLLAFVFSILLGVDAISARYFMYFLLGRSPLRPSMSHPVERLRARLRDTSKRTGKLTRYAKLHEQLALIFVGWEYFCRDKEVANIALWEGKGKWPDGSVRFLMPTTPMFPIKRLNKKATSWYTEDQVTTASGDTITGYESEYIHVCTKSGLEAEARLMRRRTKARDATNTHASNMNKLLAADSTAATGNEDVAGK